MKNHRLKVMALSAALSTGLFVGAAFAADVDDVLKAGADKVAASKSSQQQIDKIADQTYDLLNKFKGVNKQIEGLRVYNAQLENQIKNQLQTMDDLKESIENATVMERQITPLTLKMIESLGQFIELDMPFELDERRARIERLRENMDRPDLTSAEKFRQVLEAYKIEGEYGSKIETYKDTLPVDGSDREMNVLRVGRIALVAQSTSQDATIGWDQKGKQWVDLGGDYRSAVATGIKIAKKQASIEILKLPIQAPEAVQ
ncbi:MAG: DUF3450 domain-containing protein [Porticoccaceae bacterium]|nr:DUF3450 domain-containing protein [Pseudomonadales bacterium]